MASEIIESDKLHLFLLFSGLIEVNEYLESLETELVVCTDEQIQKLLIYLDIKKISTFQKHLLSIKHRLFSMTPAFWLAASTSDLIFMASIRLSKYSHAWSLQRLFRICCARIYRSSHPEVFLRKGVLKICSKFTGEHHAEMPFTYATRCIF